MARPDAAHQIEDDVPDKQERRVGVFSAQSRDLRVIGIVLNHLKSANFSFKLAEAGSDVDIVIVDHGDAAMRARAGAALRDREAVPVIHLVGVPGESGTRNELLPGQLMSHLMPLLERLAAARPAAAPASAPASAPAKVLRLATPPQPNRLRALVVDDSPTVRTQLLNVVSRIGMHCDAADSARAALEQLAANRYDVIFVDVVMPEMDGYKLTREIKRDREHRGTPVIILTSQSSPFDRARGALAGCDIFLAKPVGVKAFFEATTKALRKSMAVDDLSTWLVDPTQPRAEAAAPAPAASTQPGTATVHATPAAASGR